MQLPPLTDLTALLGINLVLCAAGLHLLAARFGSPRWAGWTILVCFVILWLPAGVAHLPLVAYVRGITSDLSVTLVALACFAIGQCLFGLPALGKRNRLALCVAVVVAATVLYPTALGWGDWDAYRFGWGSFSMLGVLFAVVIIFLLTGLRLLPALVGLGLLGWATGLMESTNLWDYLIDPWLVVGATIQCIRAGGQTLVDRYRRVPAVRR